MIKRKHANVALFVPHAGCPHDCCFCNQRTIAGVSAQLAAQDVTVACERALATLDEHTTAQIAFFGGSFTAIDREDMIAYLEAAQPFLQTGRFDGIRLSTRPDAVNDEVLGVLKRYGVTAIELGAQSMDDRVLQAAGRGHAAADTEHAAALIKQYGFSLGLQMMTGLPADTDDGAMATAEKMAALCPDTMRIYPTVVLRGTPLAAMYESGVYVPPSLEQTVALCARLLAFFERDGGVSVIRLGLHDGDALRRDVVAGGYHPALRELVEGQLYAEAAMQALTRLGDAAKQTKVTLSVAPTAVSKLIGQRKRNLLLFKRQGFDIGVKADATLPLWEVAATL